MLYSGENEGQDNKHRIKTALGGTGGFLTDFVGVLKGFNSACCRNYFSEGCKQQLDPLTKNVVLVPAFVMMQGRSITELDYNKDRYLCIWRNKD